MKKLLIPVLLLAVFAAACKKDKKGGGDDNNNKSKWEILTTTRWKVTEVMLDPDSSSENLDLLAGRDECETDNYYYFNAGGNMTLDEGNTKCNAADSQTRTDGKWILNADTTSIILKETTITAGMGDLSADIIVFNATTLRLKKDTSITLLPGNPPLTGVFYATFTKQ